MGHIRPRTASAKHFLFGLLVTGAVLTGALGDAQQAAATSGVRAGVLTCRSLPDSRVNWILYSSVSLRCVFDTPQGREHYKGTTGIGLGLDLAWRPDTELRFVVLAATSDVEIGSHSLTGHYAGGNASASIGASAGASVLLGGGRDNIALKPFAVETGSGVGVAAGLSYLSLRPGR